MVSVDVKPKVDIVDAESSRDCVSEEASGALPSLISLTVSVDVKPYVLLLHVDASPAARQSVILIFIEPMSIFVFLSPHFSFFFPQFSSVSPDVVDWAQSTN